MPDDNSPILTIDLGAVAANWRLLTERAAPAQCGASVKADCYGLGAARLAPVIAAAGCRHFFVFTLDEGVALRAILPKAEIYLLGGLPAGSERDFAAHRLIPVLNTLAEIARWREFTSAKSAPPAALHFDTGLNRLGLTSSEAKILAGDPLLLDGIDVCLVMSHLACAEEPDHPLNRRQLDAFRAVKSNLKLPGKRLPLYSLASSSGLFLGPDFVFDLVRPGAALYGLDPRPELSAVMRPVLCLQAKILQLREVDLGMSVGYGATHQCRGPSRIATIGAGYADGMFRTLGSRAAKSSGTVIVGGAPAPIVGRISMDLMTIDVGHLPAEDVRPGMLVDLIGPGQTLDAFAAMAGTIGYEILTNLGTRFKRRYVND
jgi:alanine racemase